MKALYNRSWELPFDKILGCLNDAKVQAATDFVEERAAVEKLVKANLEKYN